MRLYLLVVLILLLLSSAAYASQAEQVEEGRAALYHGDYQRALELLNSPADQGNIEAQFLLGQMHEEGKGVKQDYAEAMKWYRKAADRGFLSAAERLGRLYLNGNGVKQDYEEAYFWYLVAEPPIGFGPGPNEQEEDRAGDQLGFLKRLDVRLRAMTWGPVQDPIAPSATPVPAAAPQVK